MEIIKREILQFEGKEKNFYENDVVFESFIKIGKLHKKKEFADNLSKLIGVSVFIKYNSENDTQSYENWDFEFYRSDKKILTLRYNDTLGSKNRIEMFLEEQEDSEIEECLEYKEPFVKEWECGYTCYEEFYYFSENNSNTIMEEINETKN